MPILLPGNKKPQDLIPYGRNLALLGAFCLFLSAVEYMIPKPLPFMRIGLANLPIMIACNIFPIPVFLILVFIKIIGQALITGTLFSYIFLFSFTGTFLSALFMFLLRRLFRNRISFIGIGTAGAFVSNISQLALAQVFIFQDNVRYIAPVFLAAGLVTGIALGIFCEVFVTRSKWMGNREQGTGNREQLEGNRERIADNGQDFYLNSFSARDLFVTGFLILPALLFCPGTEGRVFLFLFFWFLAFLCGKKTNPVMIILIIVFIIAFNLIIPYGKVLFSAGIFKITQGALVAGIHRAVTLTSLVMLSKVTIRHDLKIPGAFGEILAESLRIFSAIMNKKHRITAKNFIADIDSLMMELSETKIPQTSDLEIRTKPAGFVILLIVIVISWLSWLVYF